MRVCLVTYGKFPDPSGVVAGNSVRGHLLARGLLAHGIGVDWLYPAFLDRENDPKLPSTSNIRVYSYADTADLLSRIDGLAPDVVLVGYWEMLEHFPENYARPIVVDVVAPRILESLYENGRDLSEDVTRLTTLYRRADLFICGTERQRHFLLPWLILAGFDCREQVPSIVIPISVEPAEHPLDRARAVAFRDRRCALAVATDPALDRCAGARSQGPGRSCTPRIAERTLCLCTGPGPGRGFRRPAVRVRNGACAEALWRNAGFSARMSCRT